MGVWSKLFTAVKGGVNEAAEAVVDNQALRILDQEVREAKESLRKSNHALTQIMAKRKLSEQKIESLQASVTEYEQYAVSANNKGDQSLALECAQKVAEIRTQMQSEQEYANQYIHSETTLKKNMNQAKNNLRRVEQQIHMVKATEAVQKAQVAVSSNHMGANNKMKTAAESLQRIQEKQKQRQAELESASELADSESGSDLAKRLQQAGISEGASSANAELERILGKQN